MDARREFKMYDATHGTCCGGLEFSSRVMRFENIEPLICVQIRVDKRAAIIETHGKPIYFARILYRTRHGNIETEEYTENKYFSPQAAMKNLKNKILENRMQINRTYRGEKVGMTKTSNYLKLCKGEKISKISNLTWNILDTNRETTIPFGKEVLFMPDGAEKASTVIFSKTDQCCRLCMDHSLYIHYEGHGLWAELPKREDIK